MSNFLSKGKIKAVQRIKKALKISVIKSIEFSFEILVAILFEQKLTTLKFESLRQAIGKVSRISY